MKKSAKMLLPVVSMVFVLAVISLGSPGAQAQLSGNIVYVDPEPQRSYDIPGTGPGVPHYFISVPGFISSGAPGRDGRPQNVFQIYSKITTRDPANLRATIRPNPGGMDPTVQIMPLENHPPDGAVSKFLVTVPLAFQSGTVYRLDLAGIGAYIFRTITEADLQAEIARRNQPAAATAAPARERVYQIQFGPGDPARFEDPRESMKKTVERFIISKRERERAEQRAEEGENLKNLIKNAPDDTLRPESLFVNVPVGDQSRRMRHFRLTNRGYLAQYENPHNLSENRFHLYVPGKWEQEVLDAIDLRVYVQAISMRQPRRRGTASLGDPYDIQGNSLPFNYNPDNDTHLKIVFPNMLIDTNTTASAGAHYQMTIRSGNTLLRTLEFTTYTR